MVADFEHILDEHIQIAQLSKGLLPPLQHITCECVTRLRQGAKILICGNGGSAADAQHLAAELIGRFRFKRPAIPAIALTTDSSVLTCLSNDESYAIIFARQLEALCQNNDIVLLLSTSGLSPNIVLAAEVAHSKAAYTIAWTGKTGGQLINRVDACLQVPSDNTARIQEIHILLGHIWCQTLEQVMLQ